METELDTVIQWKCVELADKGLVKKYLKEEGSRNCEFTFANIYLWSREVYAIKFAVVEDTLCFLSEGKQTSVTYPLGSGDKKRTIKCLREDFQAKGKPFHMHSVNPKQFEELQELYGDEVSIVYDRDSADYVYEVEKLVKLSGKKYHSKKNHINRFIANCPQWNYEAITEENVEECIQMAKEWGKQNGCEQDQGKQAELKVALQGLTMLEELDLTGGLIRAEGKVIAFCFGEPANEDTYVVHVEKAFAEIQGAYPLINREFLQANATKFTYVNREEDVGSEGLRKAKLSYHPSFLLEKGAVTFEEKEKSL